MSRERSAREPEERAGRVERSFFFFISTAAKKKNRSEKKLTFSFLPSLPLSPSLSLSENQQNHTTPAQADYIKAQLEALKSSSSINEAGSNSTATAALPAPPPSSLIGISFEPISVGVAAKHFGLPQSAVDAVREG